MKSRKLSACSAAAGVACAMSACSSGPLDGPATRFAIHDLHRVTPAELELLQRAEPGEVVADQTPAALPESPGVEDYVQAAVQRHPAILAAEQRVMRLRERIAQVTSLEDPMFMISPVGAMAETAAGEVGLMTSLSQRLPFPGKLDNLGRIAQQDVAIAEQDLQRVRLGVMADTRQAYWSLYYAVRAIDAIERSRSLLGLVRDAVGASIRTGGASQEAALRISVELGNLESELIALRQNRTSAAAMLNSQLDRDVDTPIADPPPIELSQLVLELDQLLALAEESSPEIAAVRERLVQFREQREQARLGRYPDLTVGVTYNAVDDEGLSMLANGRDQWWLSFSANLPIWNDRLSAAEREATRGLIETSASLAGERNRIAFQVRDALARIEAQQKQALLLRDVIVPESERTVQASLSGYRAGTVPFLNLIDNWRKVINFQLMYESSLASLERSVAQLESAIGRDVPRQPAATNPQDREQSAQPQEPQP